MRLKTAFVATFLLAAGSLLAQGHSSRPSNAEQIAPNGHARVNAGSPIDTRQFFPQVVRTIQQPVIEQINPKTPIRVRPGKGLGPTPESTILDTGGSQPGAYFLGQGFTGFVPADPDMAVGPAHIVQVVNLTINFYTKAGANTFSNTFGTFFSGVATTTSFTDPKVMYDRIAQRWVIIVLEAAGTANSAIDFAISDDSDPNGTWHRYRILAATVLSGQTHWLDYPGFGYNKDGYVICGNLFRVAGGQFGAAAFFAFPKAPALTGSAITVTEFTDTGAGSAQMAETVDAAKDTVFGAARTFTNVTRFYAARSLATTPTMVSQDFNVTNIGAPASLAASTGGASFDTVGARIFTAIWRNGKLYLSYNGAVSGSITGTHWAQYDTGNWPVSGGIAELQAGDVNNATLNQFMPALDINKWGDISVLFTQSNTSVTSNLAVAGRITTDPANSMTAPVVLQVAAGSPYNHSRWGDYFGVDVDPVDDETFWGTGMFVRADGWWNTAILSWTVSKTTNAVPTGATWIRGLAVSGGFANLAANDGSYDVAKAGPVLFAGEAPAQLQVDSVAPSGTILSLDLTVVAKANTVGLAQKVELWNWTTSSWVNVGEQSATTSNSIQSVSGSGTLSDFVQGGTKAVRAKISWRQTGPVLLWPWQVSADQVQWTFRSR